MPTAKVHTAFVADNGPLTANSRMLNGGKRSGSGQEGSAKLLRPRVWSSSRKDTTSY